MEIYDDLTTDDNVTLELFGPDGTLKDTRTVHNLVTTLGKYCAAAQILAVPGIVAPGWMEVGEGNGIGVGGTKLADFIAGSRTALTSKTRNNAIVTMVCTFIAGTGTGAITECGVFNIAAEDTTDLILYAEFLVINKGVLDTLTVTWTWTFA